MRILSAALCMLAWVSVAPAQTAEGTFVTHIGGNRVVTETFQARRSNDTGLAEAEITSPSGTQRTRTVMSAKRPVAFTITSGETILISVEIRDGEAVLKTAGRQERRMKSAASLILENLLWHQYLFLVEQYDEGRGGAQVFTALVPSQGLEIEFKVDRVGKRSVEIEGEGQELSRFSVTSSAGPEIDFWTDARGVPFLFLIPAQGVRVEREGAEKLIEAVGAEAATVRRFRDPEYADPSRFVEREVAIGSAEWVLPGTLSLPVGEGPFPAIVLVHGSGPNDRDQTVGGTKTFRDLAWGLASRGIAVLRYEKRTKHYGGRMGALSESLTLNEETVDDAVEAAALLRTLEAVDGARVFVLGHSLGGTAIPRIGLKDRRLAGLVVMAGPTRPLEDLYVEQTEYLAGLQGSEDEAAKARVAWVVSEAEKIKRVSEATPGSEQYLGVHAAYWLDLKGYDPPTVARGLEKPLLILQGERDYQVTMADFEGWKSLSSLPRVTLKSYPKLNHLFIEGEGRSTPAEYSRPDNIPLYVIEDIAAWIRSR